MKIFIMRHGQASFHAESDAQRPLTKQGVLEAELMGKWLEKNAICPDMIWVSPYLRAQQTLNAVVQDQWCSTKATTLSLITPEGSAKAVHDLIDGELSVNSVKQLLLVAHMPIVSYLVSELTQDQHAPLFQTAGLVEIDYEPSTMKGEFVSMVSPEDLC